MDIMKQENKSIKTVLITGCAGFIGAHLAKSLLNIYPEMKIIGIDNLNDYYDVTLKKSRLSEIIDNPRFIFSKLDLEDGESLFSIFKEHSPDIVVNLAAQAGVRYSLINPKAYISSNVIGFFNVLECCRHYPVGHLVYASSSSVYGSNKKVPYSVDDRTDHPVSLYAATKKANELLAYSYSKLFNIPATGLRFFTVYGPAGRPDMAYFNFTNKLIQGEKIKIFNYGNCRRDFTYIDDIITGVINVMEKQPDPDECGVRHKVYNIGNNNPENLLDFVRILVSSLKKYSLLSNDFNIMDYMELVPMQPGDVESTYADVSELVADFGFKPNTTLEEGLDRFVNWYKFFYKNK